MAWVKVAADNHPLFHAALPRDQKVTTVRLFGSIAGLVNGNMFCGLFARSAIVKLGEADYAEAMALDGAEPFDPMGTGRVMSNTVLLPETILDEPMCHAVRARSSRSRPARGTRSEHPRR